MSESGKKGPSCPRWRFGTRIYVVFQVLNVLAFLFNFAVGVTTFLRTRYGGNSNRSLGREGSRYTYLTPSTLFFSFWGVVYFVNLAFCIYQCLPMHRIRNGFLQRINIAYIVANILSGLQGILYPMDYQHACTAIMWFNSVAVVYIWIQLNFRDRPAFATRSNKRDTETGLCGSRMSGRTERILYFWLVQMPQTAFGVWVGASTTVQLATVVIFNGYGGEVWATLNWSIAWQVVLASIIIFSTAWAWDVPFGASGLIAYGSLAFEQRKNDERLYITAVVMSGLIAGTTLSVLVMRVLRFFKKLPKWNKYESDEEDDIESEMKSSDSKANAPEIGVSDLLGPRRT